MIWNELIKVVRRPVVWGMFFLTLAMNMILLWAVSGESFSPYSYRYLWETFEQKGSSLSDVLKGEQEWEQKFGITEIDQELHDRYKKELEHLLSYREYRQGILQDAEKMQNFSVFARNQFAKENVRKTADHFRGMPFVEVEPGPSLGIEKFFSRITIVFSLLFMFLIGYLLFIWEKENDLSALLSVTKRGKKPLCLSKLAAHIIAVLFHAIFLYAGNYFVLGYQYGLGDLGRSIQSVLGYKSCGYTFSVGGFLLAGVAVAVLILIALAIVFDFICICCGNLIYSAIGLLFGVGLSVLAYAGLALNSSAGWLKYISPAFCLDTGEILGKYVNIEFFGNAVYYPYVIAIVYGVLAVAAFAMSCFLYGRTGNSARINHKFGRAAKRAKRIRMSIFLFEWKKICRNSHVILLLLIFLILSISISYKERLIFDDEDEYYYYYYMDQMAGERTEEKNQFIEKTKQEFTALRKKQSELFRMSESEPNIEMFDELNRKLRPWNGFRKLLKRDNYLKQNQLSTYVYDTGFKKLVSFRDNEENRLLFLLSMLLLILLLSSVFAADREQGFEALLNLTAQRRRMNRTKIIISMLLTFITFMVMYCPQFVTFLRLYGTGGFMAPIACIKMPSLFGTNIPICLWLVWHYFKILVRMLFVGGGILLLSAKLKRVISVMVVLLVGLAGAAVLLLTTGSSEDVGEQSTVSVSSSAAVESIKGSPMQLTWLTVDYWVEDSMTEDRLAAVNQRIHELGYDFEVVFEGISDETYDDYQNGIKRAKKNGRGDLMWTGLGNENDPDGEGSYYRQIRLGNLLPLDDWLQTDMGGTLKEKYSPIEWKRITYKNQIYGVRNIKEQGTFTSLILTGDQMQEESSVLRGKTDITVTELCQWLEDYRKDPEHRFYLDWRYVDDEYNVSFAEVGYIKLCDGIYMTPEGKVENIWENEDVCRLWTCLTRMDQAGQLECDDSDYLEQVRQGEYPAAFTNVTSENMDGSYLYQEDGSKVPVESHAVAAPYLNHIENDVHGVTSWSQHPEEAMQLLTLVNTDQKLANLLYFGREGIDYQIKDGKVTSESHTDTYCPPNPKLTSFSLYEAESEDKEAYYKKANERYHLSPADGFAPNLKQAGADRDVLQRVELFYKNLLEGNGEPEKMIRDFQKELRSKKYGKVLERIQKQYNKWKKRKKNET